MPSKFYINTAIAYANAAPHIGHALEFVQADAIARFKRNLGYEVNFQLGTDEHGLKQYNAAKEAGEDTKVFSDKNTALFRELVASLNISADFFIRTTEEFHKNSAQQFWKACANDIYKDKYSGLYCVGCEAYKTEQELQGGKCVFHPNLIPEKIDEENYFFKLSKYGDQIAKLIKSNELMIYPKERKNEILNVIKGGLRDVSISRPKDKLPWGVDVPGDPDHVMYVWFDALPNYATGVGYGDDKRDKEFKKWWPTDLNIIGKDIVRFHAALWPGMLLSAGLPLPKAILVHGFVTGEGQKMSKSLGNVVDPTVMADDYGADALRYYLLREIPTTDDGDFSLSKFIDRNNYDLANDLGNLVQRVSAMTTKYLDGKIPTLNIDRLGSSEAKNVIKNADGELNKIYKLMNDYKLNEALEMIWVKVSSANAYIEETKPWKVAKESPDKIGSLLADYIGRILDIAWLLEPFIPGASQKISEVFSGEILMPIPPLFPKIESD